MSVRNRQNRFTEDHGDSGLRIKDYHIASQNHARLDFDRIIAVHHQLIPPCLRERRAETGTKGIRHRILIFPLPRRRFAGGKGAHHRDMEMTASASALEGQLIGGLNSSGTARRPAPVL